ncbi:helicase-related protein [Lichenicola sp.]|uniref:helicase-related protein n=1 Tax=Lichenicola sp. TaxID=2804529 RepID=UPI003B00FD3C
MTGPPFRPRGPTLLPDLPSQGRREEPRSGAFAPRVKAVLGPTNTGKTHLAMERLLAHSSGIIGFPLRLLARENYDRMVAQKGVARVGLITGEEKIVPPDARWFSCTVEAMPLDQIGGPAPGANRPGGEGMIRPEFVAVDEIQLCADPDRGHVFTDRLLHARGLVETMFLGAETIRPLLSRLIPQVEIETRPRLSQLLNVGPGKLTKLPPRSAVVAFSAAEVYAIAELIRRRRGGCAVVMGRLSPRTRNAQVALYQEKEVDYLVATDAIGMGLNMDVNHVGFAGLSKFDGARPRRLTAAEVAQIAGRAGRGMRDGTFGTTGTCPPMPDDIVEAVEAHRFDPLEQLFWRNDALDLSGPDALLSSLMEPPPFRGLASGNDASDLQTLQALSMDPEVRRLAVSRSATRLLWEACQIPDFRKLGDDSHTRLCARVFFDVMQSGRLSAVWLESLLNGLNRADGDIDTLMQRLSGVRVCAYIAARRDWLEDAPAWQAKAREIEDLLSDALHERLTARFVDRRAALLIRSLDEAERSGGSDLLSAVTARGEVVVEGHSVGHVSGFSLIPDPQAEGPEKRLVLRAARRALREEIPRRVQALSVAADTDFSLSEDGRLVCWNAAPVGRLRPGVSLLRPMVEVRDSEFLDGAQRERVRARLQAYVEATVAQVLAPLFEAERRAADDAEMRGVLHLLTEQAGLAVGQGGGVPAAEPQRRADPGAEAAGGPADGHAGQPRTRGSRQPVSPLLRARLKPLGVRAGRFAVFMPALLKPRPARLRAMLLAIRAGIPLPTLPQEGRISMPRDTLDGAQAGFLTKLGWVECGPLLLRLDIAERVAGELLWLTRRRPTALPADLASRLSTRTELLPLVLPALGVRMLPPVALPDDAFGPPPPAMLGPRGDRARHLARTRHAAKAARPHRTPTTAAPRDDARAEDPSAAPPPVAPVIVESATPRTGGDVEPVSQQRPIRLDDRRPKPASRPVAQPPRPPRREIDPDNPFAVLAKLRFGR